MPNKNIISWNQDIKPRMLMGCLTRHQLFTFAADQAMSKTGAIVSQVLMTDDLVTPKQLIESMMIMHPDHSKVKRRIAV